MTYIALLRGINVGGHKKIKMADLRLLFEGLGYKDVMTYIQSGNVVFKSDVNGIRKLENQISEAIKSNYGFEVPVLVKTRTEINKILGNNPFKDPEDLANNKVYFVLLKEIPHRDDIEMTSKIIFENEKFVISRECVFIRYDVGAGKAKCGINFFESKLKVASTSRNYRTMTKLLELSSN
ncbi:MAG: DUF1697 domain-containing protein [Maribacter sp.]|nr:DUF1697 domain-containing protein [Maribacter sp.]